MLTIRSAAQIRGARGFKSFRSCPTSTGVPVGRANIYRLLRAEVGLAISELRRRWLAKRWDAHQTRVRRERAG